MATPIINSQMDAINESFSKISSDLTTIRPLLKNASIGAYPTDSASGSIASFTDGAYDIPVKELKVNLEPIQNLNGYDSPWPAGGGKNKFPTATATSSGATNIFNNTALSAPSGTYTLSFTSNSARTKAMSLRFGLADSTSVEFSIPSTDSGATFTANAAIVNVTWYVREATDIKDIQLESGNARTAFAPYSNICPISGHTEVNVYRTGKNILGGLVTTTGTQSGVTYTANSDGTFTVNGTNSAGAISDYRVSGQGIYKLNLPVGDYKLSGGVQGLNGSGNTLYIAISGNGNRYVGNNGTADSSFSIAEGEYISSAFIRMANGATASNAVFKPMIRLATDTDGTYEPYAGQTYNVPLGQTVYGGTLNVTTGVLTVDKVGVDMGNETWNTYTSGGVSAFYANIGSAVNTNPNGTMDILLESYKPISSRSRSNFMNQSSDFEACHITNNSAVYIRDSRYTTAADFKTAVTGQTLVVAARTPTTVQLTATQVSTLLGQNNIWADAGTVDVTYRADTGLYIDKMIANAMNA